MTGRCRSSLVGARIVFDDGTPDILAYPTDREAYGRLCRLLSTGKLRAKKGECHLRLDDLLEWQEGMLLILVPPQRLNEGKWRDVLAHLARTAPGRVWLAAAMPYRGEDKRRLNALARMTGGVPLLGINDVLYHTRERRELQDVVTCIREHKTLANAGRLLEANAERHMKSPEEMARLFREPSAGYCGDDTLCVAHFVHLDRPQIQLSRRAGAAGADAAGISGGIDLAGRCGALSGGRPG